MHKVVVDIICLQAFQLSLKHLIKIFRFADQISWHFGCDGNFIPISSCCQRSTQTFFIVWICIGRIKVIYAIFYCISYLFFYFPVVPVKTHTAKPELGKLFFVSWISSINHCFNSLNMSSAVVPKSFARAERLDVLVENQCQNHSSNDDQCGYKAFHTVFFFVSQINDRTGGRYAQRYNDCKQFRHCIRCLTIHMQLIHYIRGSNVLISVPPIIYFDLWFYYNPRYSFRKRKLLGIS